jgi:hypothetical protein
MYARFFSLRELLNGSMPELRGSRKWITANIDQVAAKTGINPGFARASGHMPV